MNRKPGQQLIKFAVLAIALIALAFIGPTHAQAAVIPISITCVGQASPCPGTLNIGNFSVADSLQGGLACINYYNGSPAPCAVGSEPTATVTVNNPHDAIFTAATGTLKSLLQNDVPQASSLVLGAYTWDIVSLVFPNPTVCPPASTPGSCAIAGTPFTFTQSTLVPDVATVTFTENLCGYVTAGGAPGANCSGGTPYTGTFKTEFDSNINGTYTANATNCPDGTVTVGGVTTCRATVRNLLTIVANGGTITNSASAVLTPNSAVPEPSYMAFMGLGLVAIGLVGRRKTRKV